MALTTATRTSPYPAPPSLYIGIEPKFSVANTIGFLKGKSAIRIHREYLGAQAATSTAPAFKESLTSRTRDRTSVV